jgi:sterol desaturase/sphingolipid hydroxylase (fatty acid hydroxylase superfamily)
MQIAPGMRGLKSVLSWLVFPSLLAATVAATVALLARGLPPPAISAIVLLGVVAAVMVVERLAPLHRAWNRRPDALDLMLLLGNRVVDVAVVAGTVALVGLLARAGVHVDLWPRSAPLPLQAVLGIALAELVRYGFHILSHRPGLLWSIHRTHHEPRRMYALNGPRLHPGNQLWLAFANVVPMLLLGAELPALILAVNVTVFFVVFQHANLRLRFDGWNRFLATPDVHRRHHARGAAGVNYGIVLLVYDLLFGSYRAAEEDEVAADGIGL